MLSGNGAGDLKDGRNGVAGGETIRGLQNLKPVSPEGHPEPSAGGAPPPLAIKNSVHGFSAETRDS